MPRKKKEPYFGTDQENAIIQYNNTDDSVEKSIIYNKYLEKPFRIMAETILRRYPIYYGNYELLEIENNAIGHLIQKLYMFDPQRKNKKGNFTKAYSYCQTVIKNYYNDHSRNTNKTDNMILDFDDYSDHIINNNKNYIYEIDNDDYGVEKLMLNIIYELKEKIKSDPALKENEVLVGKAVINLLSNWEILFLEETPKGKYDKFVSNKYQKNKVLFLLKEQTRLSTKEIRVALKPFNKIYNSEKNMFFNDEDDE